MASSLEQISAETAQKLINQAKANSLSVEEYLKNLLITATGIPPTGNGSTEEFMHAMESMAEKCVQPLPRDFSREDIYFPEN